MAISKKIARIIDVNINRFSEGMKVVEDLLRFYWQDQKILFELRKLKNLFWQHFGQYRNQVVFARASYQDIGRQIDFDIQKRNKIIDVVNVNFKRCQESARVLEEIFKKVSPSQSRFCKTLRFALYDIEMAFLKHISINFNPLLYVILDITTIGRKYLTDITKACIDGGCTLLQLRETDTSSTRQFLNDAEQIRKVSKDANIKLIINNRLDIALAINADGVHLGKNDMPIKKVKSLLNSDMLIGITVRNVNQAQRAEKAGANYVSLGSIFPSPTKTKIPIVGINTLKKVSKTVSIPVIAIGGINKNNVIEVIQNGADGVAVISAVFKDLDFTKKNFYKIILNRLKILKKTILKAKQKIP
ncbi:MAG: thiamine phosphate synthase [candidate division WOR-3 bacterium]